jgi:2,7-dihydroxy-5-methyl-1-naphthoate 7-O-methyltransferase
MMFHMDFWSLADLATPWCLYVAATLRVAEHLQPGPTAIAALAQACQADPDALARVLRQLISKGLFAEPEPGTFALNDDAHGLLDPGLRFGLNLEGLGGRMAYPWSTLLTAVRTGRSAYHDVFGRGWWDDLEAHPALASEFDTLMGPAGHGAPDPDVLLDPTEWPRIRTVADVGGGTGSLLAAVLAAHPHLHGTLVDLPRTVVRSHEMFEPAGVLDRVTIAPQSFFDPLPAGLDLYLLKSVLCDWPDAETKAILTRCAEAARPNGRVIAVNGVTPDAVADPNLLMLILVGGKDRTLEEFRALAREAGLEVTAAGRNPKGRFQVECRAIIA